MHEKVINARKNQVHSGLNDPILRDYLRRSGSPMVTSYSRRPNGLRYTEKARQTIKRGGLVPMIYIHRVLYCLTIVSLSAVVAAIWG